MKNKLDSLTDRTTYLARTAAAAFELDRSTAIRKRFVDGLADFYRSLPPNQDDPAKLYRLMVGTVGFAKPLCPCCRVRNNSSFLLQYLSNYLVFVFRILCNKYKCLCFQKYQPIESIPLPNKAPFWRTRLCAFCLAPACHFTQGALKVYSGTGSWQLLLPVGDGTKAVPKALADVQPEVRSGLIVPKAAAVEGCVDLSDWQLARGD